LLTNVTLDNVYFDTSSKGDPAWGNSSKASFTGSPNYASVIVGSGSTNFAIAPLTGATVTGTTGTATLGAAVDCSAAFPTLKSVNALSPI
jgi:hypothetical protein